MGEVIGQDPGGSYSTWGQVRGVIYDTTAGLGAQSQHSLEVIDGFIPAAGCLFRSATWPYTVASGSNTAISGAFALLGNNGTNGLFSIQGYNFDGSVDVYAPHNLDDEEIQGVWVGRDVVFNSGAEAMTYAGLDGTTASVQLVSVLATSVTSFDL